MYVQKKSIPVISLTRNTIESMSIYHAIDKILSNSITIIDFSYCKTNKVVATKYKRIRLCTNVQHSSHSFQNIYMNLSAHVILNENVCDLYYNKTYINSLLIKFFKKVTALSI